MSTDLSAPPIPPLSEEWVSIRRDHLVNEVRRSSRAHRRPLLLGVAAVVLAGAIVSVVTISGRGTSKAFADWSSVTTAQSAEHLATADSACQLSFERAHMILGSSAPSAIGQALPSINLSDTRGPFELLVYDMSSGPELCLWGPGVLSVSGGGGSGVAPQNADTIGTGRLGFTSANGAPYSYVLGSAGSAVTAVELHLSDGTDVEATVQNGLYAAWWPSHAGVDGADVTSANGEAEQSLDLPGPG